MAISVVSLVLQGCSTGGLGPLLLGAGFLYRILSPNSPISKLTDFLSSSYIIVQSPTQYLPITGHRNVSLPPSFEWHVWSSSSGNNCHAVHGSLSSGASVCSCTAGFHLVPYCQPSPPTRFLPITGHWNVSLPPSLEWHVWLGRRSIYNSNAWHSPLLEECLPFAASAKIHLSMQKNKQTNLQRFTIWL